MTPTYNLRRSLFLDWMEEHYEVLPPAAITGLFDVRNSPWVAEPMYAISDPTMREVTNMFGAQGAKNLIVEGFISYSVANNPGNLLFYGQTDDTAKQFADTRAIKRARKIEILKYIWPDTKSAKKDNQIHLGHLSIEFLGVGKSNIEGKSAPYVLCDEKHLPQWKGMGKIVKQRASAYWDHKIINISTAGDEGCEIDLDYKRGSMEDWYLGCPACHRLCKLVWSPNDADKRLIQWQRPDKGTKPNMRELRQTVRFVCPHEGCNCEERQSVPLMMEMNRLAEYVCENPDSSPDHRSFHVAQIAYPWASWEAQVEEWILAAEQAETGDLSNLRNFIIRVMAHTWERRISNSSTAHITGDYQIIEVAFDWRDAEGNPIEKDRFATVDVQERGGRHFWVVVRAWAAGGKSRLVMAYRCETWDEVDKRVQENHVKANRVGVDSRHATEEVKEMCAKKGWHFMVADMTRTEYEWKGPGNTKVRRPYKRSTWHDTRLLEGRKQAQYAHGIIFSKTWARSVLANRIAGAGTEWGLPSDVKQLEFKGTAKLESSYLGQLNSWVEKEVESKKTGQTELQWVMINTDDHLRACEEMQLVLAGIQGLFPSELT